MTTNHNELLQKYDQDKFKWTVLPTQDGTPARTRLLVGGETIHDIMHRYMKGDQTLFFALDIDLSPPVPIERLISTARDTWLWLRYVVPTIACQIYVDANDQGHLRYYAKDAGAWANRTFMIHRQDTIDLDALRAELSTSPIPSSHGDQTWLHFVCTREESVSRCGIVFHSHHAPFDGTGVKRIISRFLTRLVESLTQPSGRHDDLAWGDEVENLEPPVCSVLSSNEPIPIPPWSRQEPSLNHAYYESLRSVNETMVQSFSHPVYGFFPQPEDTGQPYCRRQALTLSIAETNGILTSLKSLPEGQTYTVTHLAHAALAMVVIHHHPPASSLRSAFLNNFGITNCRSRLQDPYNNEYTGYCLGTSIFRIPLEIFFSPSQEICALDANMLVQVMRLVRDLYIAQASIPAPLSTMAQFAEIQASQMRKSFARHGTAPNQCYMLSSDGIGERYLPPAYSASDGSLHLSINKFFTSLNRVDPGPFFRISTWKGCMELSADFNANIVEPGVVQEYLATWRSMMTLMTSGSFST